MDLVYVLQLEFSLETKGEKDRFSIGSSGNHLENHKTNGKESCQALD